MRVARTAPMPRLAAHLLLAAWLGAALLTAAVVAPAAFAVLPTRTLAGALVGRVLPPLFVAGAAAGAAAAAVAWWERRHRALVPRDPAGTRYAGARVSLSALVVAACLVAQLAIAPRIDAVRDSIAGPVDALPRSDARRVAFGRLHALSVAVLGAAMLAGAATLVLGAFAERARSSSPREG